MPFLSGQNNQFRFQFPKIFVPDEIEKKYRYLICRIPGFPLQSTLDFLNFAIQSVQLNTGVSQEPINQQDASRSWGNISRSHEHPDKLYQKDLTITFKMDSAYLIYFILVDLYYYYYIEHAQKCVPEAMYVTLLDGFNKELYRINLHKVLFTGVDGFELNFSDGSIDMKQLTTHWRFEKLTIELFCDPDNNADTTPPTPKREKIIPKYDA